MKDRDVFWVKPTCEHCRYFKEGNQKTLTEIKHGYCKADSLKKFTEQHIVQTDSDNRCWLENWVFAAGLR